MEIILKHAGVKTPQRGEWGTGTKDLYNTLFIVFEADCPNTSMKIKGMENLLVVGLVKNERHSITCPSCGEEHVLKLDGFKEARRIRARVKR